MNFVAYVIFCKIDNTLFRLKVAVKRFDKKDVKNSIFRWFFVYYAEGDQVTLCYLQA